MNAKKRVLYSILILVAVGLDMIVKHLCTVYIKPVGAVTAIPGILDLHYCENTGAAFSILSGHTWFFIILTGLLVLLFSLYLYAGRIQNRIASFSAALIIAGGLGNLIDRCIYGYVVDMFEFTFVNFAIFNVADIFVTCGTVIFLCCYAFSKDEVVEWNLFRRKRTPDGE